MKFSVLSELLASGLELDESAIHDVDTDRIDETLQVSVFRTAEGQPVQVLFGGDRLVSSSMLKENLGHDDIKLDIRFFPRSKYPYGKFVRQSPLSEKQGVITLIDSGIFAKERVHVVSRPGHSGYFINPSDLAKAFPKATVAELTEPVITSTMMVSPSFIGHQNEDQANEEIQDLLGDPKAYLPVFLLPSTKDEILALKNLKGGLNTELSSIIESDPIFLAYFLQRVFDVTRSIDIEQLALLSIADIIEEIGVDEALSISNALAEESGTISMDVSGVEVIPEYFRFTQICAEISRNVVQDLRNNRLAVNPRLMSNLIKCYRGLIGVILGIINQSKMKEWIEITNANPHRYTMDVQFNVLGFTIMDIAKYLTENLRFPTAYKVFFANYGSPFYQGEHSDYVILNYAISSFIADEEELDSSLFKHLFKLHRHLAVKLGVMDSINSGLKLIPDISKKQELLKWRFETVSDREAKEFLDVSKVDRNYYEFR